MLVDARPGHIAVLGGVLVIPVGLLAAMHGGVPQVEARPVDTEVNATRSTGPDEYVLARVEFADVGTHRVHYLRRPFRSEPEFGVTSVDYDFAGLLARAGPPS